MNTGVSLPQGATMTNLRIYFIDEAGDTDPNVRFLRSRLADGKVEDVVNEACPDQPGSARG